MRVISLIVHKLNSFFFHKGEIGVQRFFLCCFLLAIAFFVFLIHSTSYGLLASGLVAFLVVGFISTTAALIMGICNAFV